MALINSLEDVVERAGICYAQMISQNYFVAQAVVQLACLSRIAYLCKNSEKAVGE